jgi:hypothetical protein
MCISRVNWKLKSLLFVCVCVFSFDYHIVKQLNKNILSQLSDVDNVDINNGINLSSDPIVWLSRAWNLLKIVRDKEEEIRLMEACASGVTLTLLVFLLFCFSVELCVCMYV